MKDNKFRGIDIDDGIWKYGYLVKRGDRCFIFTGVFNTTGLYPTWDWNEVFPETVGQFIRLHDKDGTEIYDGDRIDTPNNKGLVVSWNVKYASFCLNKDGWMFPHWFGEAVEPENCVIVGNVHEISESMKVNDA